MLLEAASAPTMLFSAQRIAEVSKNPWIPALEEMVTKRVQPGDVIQVPTQRGFAYALYTHKHRIGALMRVWNTQHAQPISDWSELLKQPVSFSVFLALTAAVKGGAISIVGYVEIPESLRVWPLFRAGAHGPDGRVYSWWLWEPESDREWPIDELLPEQRKLPIRQTINSASLIWYIESNWNPEKEY